MFDDSQPIEHIDCDQLTLHPVVFLFPELSAKEFDKLVASIQAQGQIDAAWITSDNQIFDGRHRWRAAQKLGLQLICRRLKHFKAETLSAIIDRVIAQNIERRQLTASQRAMIAADLEKKRIESIAAQERGDLSIDGSILNCKTSWHVADKFKTRPLSLKKANRVISHGGKALQSMVENGDIDLNIAHDATFASTPNLECALKSKDPKADVKALAKRTFDSSIRSGIYDLQEFLRFVSGISRFNLSPDSFRFFRAKDHIAMHRTIDAAIVNLIELRQMNMLASKTTLPHELDTTGISDELARSQNIALDALRAALSAEKNHMKGTA